MTKYYVCWKKNGFVDCTISCMDYNEAKRYAKEKQNEGGKTVLEECFISPQMFYGHIVAAIRAADKL